MNKEKIYDNEISPLMSQIIDICKKNKISFIATFQIEEETENLKALLCTSSQILNDSCDSIIRAHSIIRGKE